MKLPKRAKEDLEEGETYICYCNPYKELVLYFGGGIHFNNEPAWYKCAKVVEFYGPIELEGE